MKEKEQENTMTLLDKQQYKDWNALYAPNEMSNL